MAISVDDNHGVLSSRKRLQFATNQLVKQIALRSTGLPLTYIDRVILISIDIHQIFAPIFSPSHPVNSGLKSTPLGKNTKSNCGGIAFGGGCSKRCSLRLGSCPSIISQHFSKICYNLRRIFDYVSVGTISSTSLKATSYNIADR